jgi:hypothetical protein
MCNAIIPTQIKEQPENINVRSQVYYRVHVIQTEGMNSKDNEITAFITKALNQSIVKTTTNSFWFICEYASRYDRYI